MAQIKKIYILGASGKLGRMVTRSFLTDVRQDYEIIPVFRSESDVENSLIWIPGRQLPPDACADAVVALWGVTPGDGKNLEENTRLAGEAVDLANTLGADRVLHCSSAAVYGRAAPPLSEASDPLPANAYGQAKLDMETSVSEQTDGPVSVCMRIGNVAGAESLFASIRRGGPITLDRFADGYGPSRSYIAPGDIARVVSALIDAPLAVLPKVVNISAPKPTEMAEIARAAGREVLWRDAPEAALQCVSLDTSLLSRFVTLPSSSADAQWLVDDWKAKDLTA